MENATAGVLDSSTLVLPAVDSPEFIGLVAVAVIAPYLFCLGIYA
jgi:hypothetical protein